MPEQPSDKVTLTIDGQEVTVPPGTNLIEAARQLGIEIPHFCYHPRLSVAGNCRMCLVDIEKVPKNQIACSTRVAPGMIVRTRSEKAVKAREGVMEFLLINHPLDCPICDQAGECVLQEFSFHYGTGASRFEGQKVHHDKNIPLGPHIVFDAERCIKCTRCIRFCDEVTHTGELGYFNRGDHSIIGTFPGRSLDNPYSGCTADLCPVGALTVKEFRFKKRVWFLKNTESVCAGCARGCNVKLGIDENRIWRITPRDNDAVNGSWICDEGRLSYEAYQTPERLLSPTAASGEAGAGRGVQSETAWEQAAATLQEIARKHGGAAVAGITSGHATFEEQTALLELIRRAGGSLVALPVHERGEDDTLLLRKDKTANSAGARLAGGANARLEDLIAAVETGKVRALVVLREDPLGSLGPRGQKAREALDFLLVLDWRVSPTVAAADVALPVCAYGEQDGSLVNFQGRMQLLRAGLRPPGESDPAWKPLYEIAARLEGPPLEVPKSFRDAFRRAVAQVPGLSTLDTPALGKAGVAIELPPAGRA
jgi:NADH-quinone oxidoreductase subunit G